MIHTVSRRRIREYALMIERLSDEAPAAQRRLVRAALAVHQTVADAAADTTDLGVRSVTVALQRFTRAAADARLSGVDSRQIDRLESAARAACLDVLEIGLETAGCRVAFGLRRTGDG
jgi:hypothetical protein